MTNCFHCGDDDHLARNCPRNKKPAQVTVSTSGGRGVPTTWCSYCDETTRLVDLGHSVQRCANCHPLRFQQLKQGRKCPLCNKTVYEWDNGRSCEEHAGPGIPLPRPAKVGRPDYTRVAKPAPPAQSYSACGRSPLGIMVHVPGCACP